MDTSTMSTLDNLILDFINRKSVLEKGMLLQKVNWTNEALQTASAEFTLEDLLRSFQAGLNLKRQNVFEHNYAAATDDVRFRSMRDGNPFSLNQLSPDAIQIVLNCLSRTQLQDLRLLGRYWNIICSQHLHSSTSPDPKEAELTDNQKVNDFLETFKHRLKDAPLPMCAFAINANTNQFFPLLKQLAPFIRMVSLTLEEMLPACYILDEILGQTPFLTELNLSITASRLSGGSCRTHYNYKLKCLRSLSFSGSAQEHEVRWEIVRIFVNAAPNLRKLVLNTDLLLESTEDILQFADTINSSTIQELCINSIISNKPFPSQVENQLGCKTPEKSLQSLEICKVDDNRAAAGLKYLLQRFSKSLSVLSLGFDCRIELPYLPQLTHLSPQCDSDDVTIEGLNRHLLPNLTSISLDPDLVLNFFKNSILPNVQTLSFLESSSIDFLDPEGFTWKGVFPNLRCLRLGGYVGITTSDDICDKFDHITTLHLSCSYVYENEPGVDDILPSYRDVNTWMFNALPNLEHFILESQDAIEKILSDMIEMTSNRSMKQLESLTIVFVDLNGGENQNILRLSRYFCSMCDSHKWHKQVAFRITTSPSHRKWSLNK